MKLQGIILSDGVSWRKANNVSSNLYAQSKNKRPIHTHRKRNQPCGYQGWMDGGESGPQIEMVKRYKLPFTS